MHSATLDPFLSGAGAGAYQAGRTEFSGLISQHNRPLRRRVPFDSLAEVVSH